MIAVLFFYVAAFMLIFSAVMVYNNYKLRKQQMAPVKVLALKASQRG